MSHWTIRTQEADISPFYRGKWQQRKSGLAHWTGWNPSVRLQAQGPLPCETASYSERLCLVTFASHTKIYPLLSLPWAPATGRPWRSPDVQVTQAALQPSAAVPPTRGVTVWASGREPASGTASLLGHQNWSPSSEMSSPSHCNPPWSPQGSSVVTRGPFGDRQSGPRTAHCLGHKRISVPTRHSSCRGFSLLTTQHSVIAEDEAIATQSFGFIETMDLHGPRFPQVSHYFLK